MNLVIKYHHLELLGLLLAVSYLGASQSLRLLL